VPTSKVLTLLTSAPGTSSSSLSIHSVLLSS
jgi:hypothetical protein